MKNFRLNPQVKHFDLTIALDIQQLETEGWDFHDYHQNTASYNEIDIEAAMEKNYNEYNAEIKILADDEGNIGTLVGWNNFDRNETGEKTETGDDEQTIKDIIGFLNEGTLVIDESKDFSRNDNGDFVPTFIEA